MSINRQLDTLETSSLIQVFATQPELEYLFRHALIHDAAYTSLLKKDRRRLHQMVGTALESRYADRREEMAGLLAYHFGEAGESDKAVEYGRLAARHAKARYAYEEAAQHLRSALDLSDSGDDVAALLSVLEELADVYLLMREGLRALPLFQRALETIEHGANVDAVVEARLHRKIIQAISDTRWTVKIEQHDQAVASEQISRASLEAALQRVVAQTPNAETVHLLKTLSYDAWRNRLPPDYDTAKLHAHVALEVAERLGDAAEVSGALGSLANVYLARGLLREHLQVAQRRHAICADAGFSDPAERLDSLRCVGLAHMYVGRYEEALTNLAKAERLADHIHAVAQQFNALALQVQCRLRLDQWDQALELEAGWRELVQRYSRERIGVN